MNILYKYCDQLGVIKILGALELKLPFISEVNDRFECDPSFTCRGDIKAFKMACELAFERKGKPLPNDFENNLQNHYQNEDYKTILIEGARRETDKWRKQNCLLSVSEIAKNPIMWAHYTDRDKGAVIGIDFDNVHLGLNSISRIKMDAVSYSANRVEVDLLQNFTPESWQSKMIEILMTKSDSWRYEHEYRSIIPQEILEELNKKGTSVVREINNRKTWFLRLKPDSIREVIFGLDTDESLKSAIRKLNEQSELKNVKLKQVIKSKESYFLDLIDQIA